MLIGELAQRANLTTRTIRYYEQMGLITPNQRDGKFRYYTEKDLDRLHKIDSLKQLGLTLEEIAGVINLYFEDDTGIKGKEKVLRIFRGHLQQTDKTLAELESFRADLIAKIEHVEHFLKKARSGSRHPSSNRAENNSKVVTP